MSTYPVNAYYHIIQWPTLLATIFYRLTFSTTTFPYWCIHPHGSRSHGKCWIWESLLHPRTDRTASVSLLPCTLPRKSENQKYYSQFGKETSKFPATQNFMKGNLQTWDLDIIRQLGMEWWNLLTKFVKRAFINPCFFHTRYFKKNPARMCSLNYNEKNQETAILK